jgi:hypothetical protein
MEENPYKAPEAEESRRQLHQFKRFKLTLLELTVVCWVATIIVVILVPRIQTTQRLSEEQRVRNEQYDSTAHYVVVSAMAISGTVTLMLIAGLIRRRK